MSASAKSNLANPPAPARGPPTNRGDSSLLPLEVSLYLRGDPPKLSRVSNSSKITGHRDQPADNEGTPQSAENQRYDTHRANLTRQHVFSSPWLPRRSTLASDL